jgi:hypothetical protein
MDSFRESLRLQLIRKLPEFVEIDTGPESEGMGNRLRRGMAPGRRGLAYASTNCSIHRFLKGNAELPSTLFQQSGEIIVKRQSGPHLSDIMEPPILMSRHQFVPSVCVSKKSGTNDLRSELTRRIGDVS